MLDKESFRGQIAAQLQELSDEDVRFFAWLCAVRVLPFLGSEGNFDFWESEVTDKVKQKHLYSVLKALDTAAIGEFGAFSEAYSASKAAIPKLFAAYAASSAASASEVVTALYNNSYTTAINAAAAAAYYAVFSITTLNSSYDLKSILLQDLFKIKSRNYDFYNNITDYGSVWDNFKIAMQNSGCEYWFNWYDNLFKKGFILTEDDRAEVNIRINIPGNSVSNGAAEIARHVVELNKLGAEHFNEIRILILGEKGSGKTSLALRLKDPTHPMPNDDDSTEGVDIINWQFDVPNSQINKGIIVHIWDFAGHVITHAVHRCFMTERCLYILVVNGRTEGDHRIEYWLDQIHNYGGESPILVLINTQDNHRIDIQENTLKKIFPSILSFNQINIGLGKDDLENFRQSVMQHLLNNPLWKNQKVSMPTYLVKEVLRKRFAEEGSEYIHRDEFNRIAQDNGVGSEEIGKLLEDLRDLGICLWYDDNDMQEYSTMVLNPSWISHGIYRLINWGLNEKKHVLCKSDFAKIFWGKDKDRYPEDKANFLFRLMRKYQLAFFKDDERVFIPLLLPADCPSDDLLPSFPFGDRLRMEYRADRSLPEYTVSRLSVLHSEELIEEKSWRFGAVLRWNNTDAIVTENDLTRSITVSVKGPEQMEYITRLRNTLNGIFDEYKSNKPELNIELLIPDELKEHPDKYLIAPTDVDCFMQPINHIMANASIGQMQYTGNASLPWIDLMKTMQGYGLFVMGNLVLGNYNDYSKNMNIGFTNCSINLQGDLNFLARQFSKLNDDTIADELNATASDLDEIEKAISANVGHNSHELNETVTSLRKRGLLGRLENLYNDLCNEDSELRKKTIKIKNGIETIQKLGAHYNEVAQWIGLPQIPSPLLGNSKK